jgi:nitrate reductase gamma subunit
MVDMHAFIEFITGPMVWISFILFVAGVVFNFVKLFEQIKNKEPFILNYVSLKFGLRSIFAWLIPYLPASTRKSPVFYGISYLFHLFLFVVPLFLLAHVMLFEEAFGVSWIVLNDNLAHVLTLLIIGALIFFAIRRLVVPEVSYLTRASDFGFLIIVGLPFITGILAYYQVFLYQWMFITHVISGELMIILIPFTRFFHMFMAPFTRGYIGSEFGGVRHAKDW